MWIQTSRNTDITRSSNGHILVVHEATVRWLHMLVLVRVGYCAYWFDLDSLQGQGHGTFELPKIAEAVHAGGDIIQLSKGHISLLLYATVTWSSVPVVLYALCMLCDLDQIQGHGHAAMTLSPFPRLFFLLFLLNRITYMGQHSHPKLKFWLQPCPSTSMGELT